MRIDFKSTQGHRSRGLEPQVFFNGEDVTSLAMSANSHTGKIVLLCHDRDAKGYRTVPVPMRDGGIPLCSTDDGEVLYYEMTDHVEIRFLPIRPIEPKSEYNHMMRRADLERMTPAELAIRNAIHAVEVEGAHPLLTDALVLLGKAQNKVADFVDKTD